MEQKRIRHKKGLTHFLGHYQRTKKRKRVHASFADTNIMRKHPTLAAYSVEVKSPIWLGTHIGNFTSTE